MNVEKKTPKGCLYACSSQFYEKKIVCDFFYQKRIPFLRMTMYLVFEKKQNTLNLLFNSRVNLNNAMKRIICDLCMPHAFFTGTFNCLAKEIFFTQDCENSKKC